MVESDLFYVKWGADDDGAMEKWLWLLFVELWAFLSPKFALQNGLEKVLIYPNNWNAVACQRRLWRHWKLLGREILIKHFKESGFAPETFCVRNVATHLLMLKNGSFLWFFSKGDFMKTLWKASILQMAESGMFYVKWGADEDGAMEKWLWLLFVELWAFFPLKFALQNGLEKVLLTEQIGLPLRAKGDCDVTESYLEWRSWSSTSRKVA